MWRDVAAAIACLARYGRVIFPNLSRDESFDFPDAG
jgi:hypothetical protein